ncbi:MAG: alpha/beta hydrolase [Nitratireductor sp.]
MVPHKIKDWDDAYANMTNVPRGEIFPELWDNRSQALRQQLEPMGRYEPKIPYAHGERNFYDLYLPQGEARGVHVFIHGGYWMRFDSSSFSFLAQGSLERGYAVAMPSYPLCPKVRISEITRDIATAIEAISARFTVPLFISGHSAGGHLATRMVCDDSALDNTTRQRIRRVMSISGVHDLRPLLRLELNSTLQLDPGEAALESAALHAPATDARIICWVGAGERSEFIRQNALLANIWTGLGAETMCVEEADRHHFNVIDGLADTNSTMTEVLLS